MGDYGHATTSGQRSCVWNTVAAVRSRDVAVQARMIKISIGPIFQRKMDLNWPQCPLQTSSLSDCQATLSGVLPDCSVFGCRKPDLLHMDAFPAIGSEMVSQSQWSA